MKPQVDKSVYFSPKYLSPARLTCYSYQFREIVALMPGSILEIGIGSGLLSFLLRKAGFNLTTVDFDKALEPDIVASVTDIPLPDNSVDVVACFQVLEHLPFEMFSTALGEMRRITRKHIIISLPDCGRFYKMEINLPKIGRRKLSIQLPFFRPALHKFDGEHYWEVNKKGYSLKSIIRTIETLQLSLTKTYRIWEAPRQRNFVMEKSYT